MIKLNSNAWYMHFYMSVNNAYPKNLCQFMRMFVLTIILYLCMFILATAFISMLFYPILYLFNIATDGTVAIIFGTFDIIWSYLLLQTLYKEKIIKKNLWLIHITIPNRTKIPNTGFVDLVVKYAKAIHDKTCPLIEVHDDKKNSIRHR